MTFVVKTFDITIIITRSLVIFFFFVVVTPIQLQLLTILLHCCGDLIEWMHRYGADDVHRQWLFWVVVVCVSMVEELCASFYDNRGVVIEEE